MKRLLKSYIVPQFPVLIPEIGRAENAFCRETARAMERMAVEIESLKPKRIILVGPQGLVFSDAFSVYYKKKIRTDFDTITLKNIDREYRLDLAFIDKLSILANKRDITLAKIDESLAEHFDVPMELDRGAGVPLHFISQCYSNFEIVPITYGLLPVSQLYEFGTVLKKCIDSSDKPTVFLAVGALSHCLSASPMPNYTPVGKKFDEMLMDTLSRKKPFEFLTYSLKEKDMAQSCIFQSLCVLYGMFEKSYYNSDIYSYQAPFGIGYMVAAIDEVHGISPSLLPALKEHEEKRYEHVRRSEDDYIRLARDTIEFYVMNKKIPFWDRSKYQIRVQKAGCFISLKTESGLRGFVGTVEPKKQDIFQEIVHNAVLVCSEEERFDLIEEYELDELFVSVHIVTDIEPVNSVRDLEPAIYGVIVSSGEKKGIVFPDLDGVHSPTQQITLAVEKAGIHPGEAYSISRFSVETHEAIY